MTGGIGIRTPVPITNEEMNLGVMLLHIAHENPEIVSEKRFIKCSDISFPGTVASKFADVPNTREMFTLPPQDFVRIIDKLIHAELQCRLTTKRGKVIKKNYPMVPVMLIDDTIDPMVMFTAEPQCYFVEERQDGQVVRQMKPKGEMLQFMLDHMEG